MSTASYKTKCRKLRTLWKRHLEEERHLVRTVLDEEDWKLGPAAERLGCAVSTLQSVLSRHPALDAERLREMRLRGGKGVTKQTPVVVPPEG